MRRMVTVLGLVVLLTLGVRPVPVKATQPEEQAVKVAAKKAAQDWLTLLDQGRYGRSWETAAELFKAAVNKGQWSAKLRLIGKSLGKVVSRELVGATFTRTLPGAPDGDYVVIQYKTEFEKKNSAVETVTPMLDPDGVWRVSGYFIR
jgi:hypothetical protein